MKVIHAEPDAAKEALCLVKAISVALPRHHRSPPDVGSRRCESSTDRAQLAQYPSLLNVIATTSNPGTPSGVQLGP
jgi:hypothetical protein